MTCNAGQSAPRWTIWRSFAGVGVGPRPRSAPRSTGDGGANRRDPGSLSWDSTTWTRDGRGRGRVRLAVRMPVLGRICVNRGYPGTRCPRPPVGQEALQRSGRTALEPVGIREVAWRDGGVVWARDFREHRCVGSVLGLVAAAFSWAEVLNYMAGIAAPIRAAPMPGVRCFPSTESP